MMSDSENDVLHEISVAKLPINEYANDNFSDQEYAPDDRHKRRLNRIFRHMAGSRNVPYPEAETWFYRKFSAVIYLLDCLRRYLRHLKMHWMQKMNKRIK